jgi:Ca2+-transporting ATPase
MKQPSHGEAKVEDRAEGVGDRAEGVGDKATPAFHVLTVEEALDRLDSHEHGLAQEEVEDRLEQYGPNEIKAEEKVSVLALLWSQIMNPLVGVLVMAALVSLAANKTTDAIVIGVVIVVNTLIGFSQEYKAETALEALKSRSAPEAEVIRECLEVSECIEERVPATQIVPGDIIVLGAGDRVPADGRLIEAVNLELDESMLTGESQSVRKGIEPLDRDLPVAERTNLVYGGTTVTDGRGRAVIYATGSETQMGQIARLIEETEKAESPIQRQTRDLSKKLGILAVSVATITLLLGLWRQLPLEEMFLFALASAVSSIPEGLPAVMSITLAVGVNRMAKRNALIRRLAAIDTLGAATVIATDKTGTLTTNQMTVQQIYVDEEAIDVTGVGFAPDGEFQRDGESVDPEDNETLGLALRIGVLCNDARLIEHYYDDRAEWEIRGDPTEGALVVAAAKAGQQKEALRDMYERIDEIPFSSERQFMATFHDVSHDMAHVMGDDTVRVMVKGAPEVVLERCDRLHLDGEAQDLGAEQRTRLLERNEAMAAGGLRVLGLAYETIASDEIEAFKEDLQAGRAELIFVGLAGMIDPARPEVPEAVSRCVRAGIRPIMVTGDHKLTAEAIARQVGILQEDGESRTGRELDEMTDEALDETVERVSVFARVAPEQKHRIVESLHRQGHVVAVTGDGVNDAPALQAAEIGVAMGITGTDVTKETAEMVLTDDNFGSIVAAIEEGRVIFQNVRKVVKYLLATNIGEDLTLIGALLLLPGAGLIVTPVQILWVNLVTDGVLDIALAMEPKEQDVMDDPPRDPNARIINPEILGNIFYVALFMAAGTLWMFTQVRGNNSASGSQTMAFTTLAMFQVFNSLNCRSRTKSLFQLGLLTNPYLIGAIGLSVTLQIAATYVPFMQIALATEPLALADWGMIALVSSSIFVADEIRKFIARRMSR